LSISKRFLKRPESPYCALINLYLRECTANRKRLAIQWKPAA
jgi:hypothetical protein